MLVLLLVSCKNKDKTLNIDFSQTKTAKFNNLSFIVPVVFEEGSETSKTGTGYTLYSENKNGQKINICSFHIVSHHWPMNDRAFDIYLSQDHYEEYSIKQMEINGTIWKYAEANNIKEKNIYYNSGLYVANHNNYEYLFIYTDYRPENKECNSAIHSVINSLNFNN